MDRLKDQVLRKVIELAAAQAGVEPETVRVETHFVNDLNFDSLDGVDFSMKVEDAFKITMPEMDGEKLDTVGKVVEYVVAKSEAAAAKAA